MYVFLILGSLLLAECSESPKHYIFKKVPVSSKPRDAVGATYQAITKRHSGSTTAEILNTITAPHSSSSVSFTTTSADHSQPQEHPAKPAPTPYASVVYVKSTPQYAKSSPHPVEYAKPTPYPVEYAKPTPYPVEYAKPTRHQVEYAKHTPHPIEYATPTPFPVEYVKIAPTAHPVEYAKFAPTAYPVEYAKLAPTAYPAEYAKLAPTAYPVEYAKLSPTAYPVEYAKPAASGYPPVKYTTPATHTYYEYPGQYAKPVTPNRYYDLQNIIVNEQEHIVPEQPLPTYFNYRFAPNQTAIQYPPPLAQASPKAFGYQPVITLANNMKTFYKVNQYAPFVVPPNQYYSDYTNNYLSPSSESYPYGSYPENPAKLVFPSPVVSYNVSAYDSIPRSISPEGYSVVPAVPKPYKDGAYLEPDRPLYRPILVLDKYASK